MSAMTTSKVPINSCPIGKEKFKLWSDMSNDKLTWYLERCAALIAFPEHREELKKERRKKLDEEIKRGPTRKRRFYDERAYDHEDDCYGDYEGSPWGDD